MALWKVNNNYLAYSRSIFKVYKLLLNQFPVGENKWHFYFLILLISPFTNQPQHIWAVKVVSLYINMVKHPKLY